MYSKEVNELAAESWQRSIEHNEATHDANLIHRAQRDLEHEAHMANYENARNRSIENQLAKGFRDRQHDAVQKEIAKFEIRERIAIALTNRTSLFALSDAKRETRVARIRRLYGEAAQLLDMDIDKEIADALSEEDMSS